MFSMISDSVVDAFDDVTKIDVVVAASDFSVIVDSVVDMFVVVNDVVPTGSDVLGVVLDTVLDTEDVKVTCVVGVEFVVI